MRAWLPRISLIDVGAGEFRYRVVGTDIVGLRGFDPTGRNVEAAWPREDAERVQAAYAEVVESRSPIFCHPAERRHAGQDPVVGVMLLPLSGDGENVDQILGYLGDEVDMFDPVI